MPTPSMTSRILAEQPDVTPGEQERDRRRRPPRRPATAPGTDCRCRAAASAMNALTNAAVSARVPMENTDVGAEHREAGEEAGPRPDGAAHQSVRRSGVVEVAGQPDEAVPDERHPDQADDEHQRDGLADGGDQALAVARHRQGRPDQGDRHRQRHPERQPAMRDLIGVRPMDRPTTYWCSSMSPLGIGFNSSTPGAGPWVISAGGRSPKVAIS